MKLFHSVTCEFFFIHMYRYVQTGKSTTIRRALTPFQRVFRRAELGYPFQKTRELGYPFQKTRELGYPFQNTLGDLLICENFDEQCEPVLPFGFFFRVVQRRSLGIMEARLKPLYLKAFNTIVLWWSRGASLSDSYTPDRCCSSSLRWIVLVFISWTIYAIFSRVHARRTFYFNIIALILMCSLRIPFCWRVFSLLNEWLINGQFLKCFIFLKYFLIFRWKFSRDLEWHR